MGESSAHRFADDGLIPNSRFPLVVFRAAVAPGHPDPARAFEDLFARNGWTEAWRDGIFRYHHYHSTAHEVLGLARGRADVRFGGEGGETLALGPGDAVAIPAGVGHKLISAPDELLVVGAYAGGRGWDIIRGDPNAIEAARRNVAAVPVPDADPVHGPDGPLVRLWTAQDAVP